MSVGLGRGRSRPSLCSRKGVPLAGIMCPLNSTSWATRFIWTFPKPGPILPYAYTLPLVRKNSVNNTRIEWLQPHTFVPFWFAPLTKKTLPLMHFERPSWKKVHVEANFFIVLVHVYHSDGCYRWKVKNKTVDSFACHVDYTGNWSRIHILVRTVWKQNSVKCVKCLCSHVIKQARLRTSLIMWGIFGQLVTW